jgi:hypothetical protein
MLFLLLASLSPATAADAAGCPQVTTDAALNQTLAAAETAFADLDDAFDTLVPLALEQLDCLDAPLDGLTAARLHRVQGLWLHSRDQQAAALSFAAARRLDPGYSFPTSMLGPNEPHRTTYGQVALNSLVPVTQLSPASGRLYFDGKPTLDRPSNWPTIFQYEDGDGLIQLSTYLEPGDTTPAYPVSDGVDDDGRDSGRDSDSGGDDRRGSEKKAGATALRGGGTLLIGAGAGLIGFGFRQASLVEEFSDQLISENVYTADQQNALYNDLEAIILGGGLTAIVGLGVSAAAWPIDPEHRRPTWLTLVSTSLLASGGACLGGGFAHTEYESKLGVGTDQTRPMVQLYAAGAVLTAAGAGTLAWDLAR